MLGGTFDPPHIGHLVAALEARARLGLDRVLLVVANEPWQKIEGGGVSSAEDRLAMTRAAVAGVDGLEASAIEIERGGTSYTVDTLDQLQAQHPGVELALILGSDAAANIETWERPSDVAARCRLVVVDRGDPAELPEAYDWERVHMPRIDLSSSELRQRVAVGDSLDFLVPDAVRSIIDDRGLYREPGHG